jgi:hypothetical protein
MEIYMPFHLIRNEYDNYKVPALKVNKYLNRQFAEKMLNQGEIRIGTLSHYRNIEDPRFSDPDEGKKEIFKNLEEPVTIEAPEDWKNKVGDEFDEIKNRIILKGPKLTISKRVTIAKGVDDIYIYCTSMTSDSRLLKKFNAECCVEIFNVQRFQDITLKKLVQRDLVYPQMAVGGPVQYIGHSFQANPSISGNWLKDEKYSEEREYRFNYFPLRRKNGKSVIPTFEKGTIVFPDGCDTCVIEPVTIKSKLLKECCRLIELREKNIPIK